MKKAFLKIISACLVLTLTLSLAAIPASAFSWDTITETNYADRYTTDNYTTGKFYKNMTRIPLTGDGARDVVAVAASQVGYLEGDSSYGYNGEVGGSTNYTEYGYYMGMTGGASHAWCAAFCSWVFYTAEVTDIDGCYTDTNSGNIWADTFVPDWSNYLMSQGRYRYSEAYRGAYAPSQELYIPQSGDLVFFYSTSDDYPGWEGHIGIVAYCDGDYVYTLEGNTSSQDGVEAEGGGMFFKKYSLWSGSLIGFGIMPYETVEGLPPIDYSGANPTPGLYVTTSGAKSVYLDINDSVASWTLPMSSVFEVIEIDYDSNGVLMLYSKCEIDGETIYGWIVNGSSSNGYTRTLQIYANPNIEIPDVEIDGTPFWVTHYNTEAEGSGVIMTEPYIGGQWNLHVAFAPVEGVANTYEITAISDGIINGDASPLSIPEGGFVYMLNKGNDWPSLYASDPVTYSYAATYPDYTSDACDSMIATAQEWKVGDKLELTNIDIATQKVPTVTAYLKWYNSSYKCTAGFKLYTIGDDDDDDKPQINPMDINGDGSLDLFDYLSIKTHYFNTIPLTGDALGRADVNKDGTIDMFDYMEIKYLLLNGTKA